MFTSRILRPIGSRGKSTLIPPSVSSLREIGKLSSKFPQAHPEIFASLKNLYKNLPKGNAVKKNPNGFYEWYVLSCIECSKQFNYLEPINLNGKMIPFLTSPARTIFSRSEFSSSFRSRYYEKYVETNSLAPIAHFFAVMVPLGYYLTYIKGGHYHPRYEFH